MRANSDNYREIFLNGTALMDVRAPLEFRRGAFPNTANLPLMDDDERQKVGTCYRQHGQEAAIRLGHKLVSGLLKDQRIQTWREFATANPEGYLYCFRGGLRSQLVQEWLKVEAGIDFPRIIGGYKAMRGFLIDELETSASGHAFTLLGGLTGTGKTELLVNLNNAIDLEAHAGHRGSSFGRHVKAQPPQISFENNLAIDFLSKRQQGLRRFVLEDESRGIGSCSVPLGIYQKMQQSPIVWLEDSLESRVERILQEYVIQLSSDFVRQEGTRGFDSFAARLRQSLDRITKRLGYERHAQLAKLMDAALADQLHNGSVERHREWIVRLLGEYYDPMYEYQRRRKSRRIVFAGTRDEVLAYLLSPDGHQPQSVIPAHSGNKITPFAQ